MGIRQDIKDFANANFDPNGVGGITGLELNAHANAIADGALIKGEAGDLAATLQWVGGVLTLVAVPWALLADVPSTFPPSMHSHVMADVTDLAAALALKAPLASPNFNSGNVTISAGHLVIDRTSDAAYTQFQIRGDIGQNRDVTWFSGTSTRWNMRVSSAAEAGANAGSNWSLIAYDDAGVAIGSVIDTTRATRAVSFPGAAASFANSPTAPTPAAADNTTKLATTAFVTTAVAGALGANDAMLFKGAVNASTNPNYPAADAGHVYRISAAGKIGGASGPNVEINDTIYCILDGSAAGDHATVGANWIIVQSNIDGAVIGPASAVDSNPVVFNGSSGKLIKEVTYADFKTSLAIMVADVGGLSVALGGKSDVGHGHAIGDISGLALIASSGSASDLIAGIVPDARLSGSYTGLGSLTLSGTLTISSSTSGVLNVKAATTAGLFLDSPAGQVKGVYFRTGTTTTLNRWTAFSNTTAETGANAGSNFQISRYDDAGAHLGAAVLIDRATGLVAVGSLSATDLIGTGAAPALTIRPDTVDGADSKAIHIAGGGAIGALRGAYFALYGNEHATGAGDILLQAGDDGDISVIGGSKAAAGIAVRNNTADGADSGYLQLAGGGSALTTRGAWMSLYGNEHATYPGHVRLAAGDTGQIELTGVVSADSNLSVAGTSQLNGSVTTNGQLISSRAGAGNGISLISTDATATHGPSINMYRDSATAAAADEIGGIFFQGNEATTDTVLTYGAIRNILRAVGNGAEDLEMQIQTTMNGGLGARLLIGLGLHHAAATGGDKGTATINMDAVYDDGVLLTCIPLQSGFLERGEIDLKFWDDKVPDQVDPEIFDPHTLEVKKPVGIKTRTHAVARLFKDLVESGCDPRDPEKYFARMKQDAALPGMPLADDWYQSKYSLGQMVSRQWLASEMLAVATMNIYEGVAELKSKVAALEARL